MDISTMSKFLIPVIWVLVQNLLIIYGALKVLGLAGLVRKPVAGLEYSQVVMAAVLLFTMLCLANAPIQSYYDTCLNYAVQQGAWVSQTMFRYSQYFLVIIVVECLLVGIYWLVVKVFFNPRESADQRIATGNLPLAILVSGIIAGTGLGLARLVAIILGQLTPHYILLNG